MKEGEPKYEKQPRITYLRYAYDLAKELGTLPDNIEDLPVMIKLANEDKIFPEGEKLNIDPQLRKQYKEVLGMAITIKNHPTTAKEIATLFSSSDSELIQQV